VTSHAPKLQMPGDTHCHPWMQGCPILRRQPALWHVSVLAHATPHALQALGFPMRNVSQPLFVLLEASQSP
jgi:hypothetical protein